MSENIIFRQDICRILNVTPETVRRWLKAGKLPKPDVNLSQKTRGWKLSTLQDAGILLM